MSAFIPVRPYLHKRREMEIPAREERFVLIPPYLHGRPPEAQKPEVLPSIDEFLDRQPPIEHFAPDVMVTPPAPVQEEWPSWGGEANPPATASASEWGGDDWQGYDWGSAANLGSAPDPAAQAWAATDWSEPAGSRESRSSAAEALAHALDQIARRIRTGELRVPGPDTAKDDTAIAGTLAALLGIRR
jgi:hypothetical protein